MDVAMSDPLITLTTDFGDGSPYVAAMKGVILGINPQARLVDLSHHIPPQDVRHTAFFLRAAVPYFPHEVLHLVVVDPGVGTERALLYVEVGGHRLLVPDNGCWTELAQGVAEPPMVLRLAEPRYWRPQVSATFHGRDMLAPAAGHLSRGLDPRQLGPPARDWVRLEMAAPQLGPEQLTGEVVFIDDFGNLLTNLPGDTFTAWGDRDVRITVGAHEIERRVRTYGEAEPGTLVALVSSAGTLELAESQGNAAARLGIRVGAPVAVTRLS
jgi:S-adenosyl-L-methionine hydrolase (adenosine-forming)